MKRNFRRAAMVGADSVKEQNFGKSMTVPDQSMSVRTIIQRFANGTLPDVYGEPMYSEDNLDVRGMDISELYELRDQARQDVKDITAELKKRKSQKSDVNNDNNNPSPLPKEEPKTD